MSAADGREDSYTQLHLARRGESGSEDFPETSEAAKRKNSGVFTHFVKEKPATTLSLIKSDLVAFKNILCSGINVLLIFVPIGLLAPGRYNSAIVFSTNFMAIVPLAAILGEATDALAEHTGQTVGGLVNASFGNAVEIIITIDAVKKGLCDVVKAGLIGSVLSNLLLVLGMAFIASGVFRKEQEFNKDGAGASTTCLLVAATSTACPTLFAMAEDATEEECTNVSRICAIIMAIIYCFFLYFQLVTHGHHFEEKSGSHALTTEELSELSPAMQRLSATLAEHVHLPEDPEEDEMLSPWGATALLFSTTLIVAYLSEAMVGSIEDVSEHHGVPQSFIGLILLPIVGNAAEHMTAVVAAFRGKMDLAISVAIGSSTQIALLVVPFSILIGWVFDEPMNLNFGVFYSGVFLLTVFLVTNVVTDGFANWLEGLMLVATYVMIAVVSWNMD